MSGDYIDALSLSGRITIASMATEMGGIIIFFLPNYLVMEEMGLDPAMVDEIRPDPDAVYEKEMEIDIQGLEPMVSRPGHPEDVTGVSEVKGTKIDSAFIGSCTNGRFEDMKVRSFCIPKSSVKQQRLVG